MRPLSAFLRDTSGSASIEAALMLPLMAWCFLGTYVFFDGYRNETANIRAAYTVGDTLSRETGYVTPTYLANLHQLQTFMAQPEEVPDLRVTVFHWDPDATAYRVNWSQGRGAATGITDAGLNDLAGELPDMPGGEVAIMVQSWVQFEPVYSFVGVDPVTMYDMVITRPRFAGQLCWNPQNDGDQSTAIC